MKATLIAVLLLAGTLAYGQTVPPNQYAPTPKALEMTRSGHLPADLNSGTVGFEIPIYTFSDRDFNVPVSLRYTSSWFQPARMSGEAGLHWSLQAGGMITREIVGIDDFSNYGLYGNAETLDESALYNMTLSVSYNSDNIPNVNGKNHETASDLYRFTIPGHSGSFVLNHDRQTFSVFNTQSGKGAYEVTYEPISQSFTIKTGDGYQYRFGYNATNNSAREQRWLREAKGSTEYPRAFLDGELVTVTWLLDRITAPNGRTVDFVYTSNRYNQNIPQAGDDVLTSFHKQQGSGSNPGAYKAATLTYTSYLSQIVVDSQQSDASLKQSASFTWTEASSKEIASSDLSVWTDLVVKRKHLSSVIVSDGGNQVRSASLSYQMNGTRPLLQSVSITGFGSYQMTYYTDSSHPLPGLLTNGIDLWGYYNGKDGNANTSISPTTVNGIYDESITASFMDADSTYSRLGMLQQITYPTGGSTRVTYEANRASKVLVRRSTPYGPQPADPTGDGSGYAFLPSLYPVSASCFNGHLLQCGGVRVASLTDDDGIGELSTRTFSYENENGTSSGIIQQYPRFFAGILAGYNVYNPALHYPGSSFDELPVAYSRVTERFPDGSSVTTEFSDWESDPDGYSSNRKVYDMSLGFSDDYYRFLDNILREPDSRAYRRGRPTERHHYDSDGTPVRDEAWTYTDKGDGYAAYVIGSGRYWWSARRFLCDRLVSRYEVTDYPDDGGSSHTEFTEYDYDENNLLSLERHGSGTTSEETRVIYSGTTSQTGNVYVQMASDHVVALPVERQVWRGSQLVSAERTAYQRLGTNHYVPSAVFKAPASPGTGAVNYDEDPEVTYESYDSMGNPVVLVSRDGTPSTWYWSKDGKHPVAFFGNARSGEQTVPVQGNNLTTETSAYSNSQSVTISFVSSAQGLFFLGFINASAGSADISATLDGVELTLLKLTDLQGVNHFSYQTKVNGHLPAGPHTLTLRGVPAQIPLSVQSGPTPSFNMPFSGTLTIRYMSRQAVFSEVDEENVVFEDFEMSGGTAGAGINQSRGRTSTYSRTVQVHPGRSYVLDWMKKNGSAWEYRSEILSSSTGNLTLAVPASSSSPVDNIRFFPGDGSATSWTWNGNVGMSSETDSRGITEYYTYDGQGRLSSRQDNDRNPTEAYSYQYTPGVAGGSFVRTDIFTSASNTYRRTIAYHDGLGRPYQTVRKGASPLSSGSTADLAEWMEYDQAGRPAREWLPVSVSAGSSSITPSTFRSKSASSYGSSEEAWTVTEYDGTSLERIRMVSGPGKSWHDAGKGVEKSYLTSAASGSLRCGKYQAVLSGNTDVTIQKNGYYGAGELSVEKTVDEDGRVVLVFTDCFGQKVLERRLVSGSASSSSASWADTYYLYDALGRLVVVLPPMLSDAVAASSWSSGSTSAQSKVSSYAYQYRYDARGRVMAKKLPGAQWIYYVYDRGDRLVLTQDGNRRSAGQWQFSLQDQLGRECLNGVISAEYDAFASPLDGSPVFALRSSDYGSSCHGYDPVGVSLSGSTILEVSWWDNYGYIGEDSLTPESDCGYESAGESAGYGARYAASAQGLLTGSLTGMLGESGNNEYLWKSVYYDAKGRAVQEKSSNHLGGIEKVFRAFDFVGNCTKELLEHLDGDGTVLHQETYTYTYDGWGRPKVTTHKLGSGSAVTLHSRTYDMLGREVSDSRNGSSPLNTQYTYNVRSYPLSISVGSSGSTFSETLYYESGRNGASVTSPQWGGNISRMDWKTGSDNVTRVYQYGYDPLSRLTSASYSSTSYGWQDNFSCSYLYDKNGNLTTYTWRLPPNYATNTSGYSYTGNQLSSGSYDANGNLTSGLGGTTSYNLLNLPEGDVRNGQTLTYLYTADGRKLRQTVVASSETDSTDYVGNLVYRNGVLEQILIDGGYIDMTGNSPAYRFFVTDHLDGIRAVASSNGSIIRTNHYDPYGREILPQSTSTSTVPESTAGTDAASRYMFGGKEWDAGISLYDFSARMYNPAQAAFTTVDPLAEKYYNLSPYSYCASNPVNLVDPEGKSTRVKKCTNGTYVVIGGDLYDNDLNIYEYSMDQYGFFTIKGESIGQSATLYSFYDTDTEQWAVESIINPNEKSGIDFLKMIAEGVSIDEYINKATGYNIWDYKITDGRYIVYRMDIYRGVPINYKMSGQQVFASARDVGNIAAGFVAGLHGLPWFMTRLGFDIYQSYQESVKQTKLTITLEGLSTRSAQRYGWDEGHYKWKSSLKNINQKRSK